jgi:hypothetical protein
MVRPVVIQKFARMGSWVLAGTRYGTLAHCWSSSRAYDENLGPDRSFTTSMPKALFLFVPIVPTERMRPLTAVCADQLTGFL